MQIFGSGSVFDQRVPQRLKPQLNFGVVYGTHSTSLRAGSEAVPLSKTLKLTHYQILLPRNLNRPMQLQFCYP